MLKTQWYGRRRGAEGQRGAALVEAALILPLLMFLIFGVIELGSLLSTYSSTANAVRAGGRMASVQGSDATADQATLERIATESTAIRNGEIQFVIIWRASGPDDTVPSGCLGAAESLGSPNTTSQGVAYSGGPGACNVYAHPQANGGAFQMASGALANPPDHYFGCTGSSDPEAGHKVDCRWPSTVRNTQVSARGVTPVISPDYVGIYIRVEYRYVTGLLGVSRTINDSSITLLEPDNYGVTP